MYSALKELDIDSQGPKAIEILPIVKITNTRRQTKEMIEEKLSKEEWTTREVIRVWECVFKIPNKKENEEENRLEIIVSNSDWIKEHAPEISTFKALGIESLDDIKNLSWKIRGNVFINTLVKYKDSILKLLEEKNGIDIWNINIQEVGITYFKGQKVEVLESSLIVKSEQLLEEKYSKYQDFNNICKKMFWSIVEKITQESIDDVLKNKHNNLKKGLKNIFEELLSKDKNTLLADYKDVLLPTLRDEARNIPDKMLETILVEIMPKPQIMSMVYEYLCKTEFSKSSKILDEVFQKIKNNSVNHSDFIHSTTPKNFWCDVYWNSILCDVAIPWYQYIPKELWEELWTLLDGSNPSTKVKYKIL
jgi:hypothetical protein